MKQIKNQDTVIKKPISLDSVPEDIAEVIVDFVRSWTEIESDDAKRETERKIRDSSLLSISLASRQSSRTFANFLLQSITFKSMHLTTLYNFVGQNEEARKLVKFLRIENSDEPKCGFFIPKGTAEVARQLPPNIMTPINAIMPKEHLGALNITINAILHRLERLETFINTFPEMLSLQLVQVAFDKTFKPFPSMLLSVKRLEINSTYRYAEGILARNAVWILTFCPNLRQAIFAVLITIEDSKFLAEYVEVFQGLSKVQDLAIRLNFPYDETNRRTWWGLPVETKQSWKKGNRKSDSIFHFLQVTNKLNSLEMWTNRYDSRKGDKTPIYEDCLDGLYHSFETLKHLRVFGPQIQIPNFSHSDFSRFRACKILSLDYWGLSSHEAVDHRQFPPNLEMLCLDHYDYRSGLKDLELYLNEDVTILNILSTRLFPNLKVVAVPSEMINRAYKESSGSDQEDIDLRKKWVENRETLKESKLIRERVFELRLLKVGEIVGDPIKGESCLATHARYSPFCNLPSINRI